MSENWRAIMEWNIHNPGPLDSMRRPFPRMDRDFGLGEIPELVGYVVVPTLEWQEHQGPPREWAQSNPTQTEIDRMSLDARQALAQAWPVFRERAVGILSKWYQSAGSQFWTSITDIQALNPEVFDAARSTLGDAQSNMTAFAGEYQRRITQGDTSTSWWDTVQDWFDPRDRTSDEYQQVVNRILGYTTPEGVRVPGEIEQIANALNLLSVCQEYYRAWKNPGYIATPPQPEGGSITSEQNELIRWWNGEFTKFAESVGMSPLMLAVLIGVAAILLIMVLTGGKSKSREVY